MIFKCAVMLSTFTLYNQSPEAFSSAKLKLGPFPLHPPPNYHLLSVLMNPIPDAPGASHNHTEVVSL